MSPSVIAQTNQLTSCCACVCVCVLCFCIWTHKTIFLINLRGTKAMKLFQFNDINYSMAGVQL